MGGWDGWVEVDCLVNGFFVDLVLVRHQAVDDFDLSRMANESVVMWIVAAADNEW